MKLNASPGPDGFNVEFYLAAWDWIGEEVTQLVTTFYKTGILPPHINDTNIALIPKKLVPQVPMDYRPISLCNVVYKIIAKSLANRIKPHLPDYIDPAQQAFIEGRRISDNIIIAQEITHSFALKSWNHHAFMLKIDLAKAFDRLEWSFIVSALARKGLHGHFINLIHACISSPTFSVLINGQPSHKFKSFRGIRQGCPMSPYLFVIAINELSVALNEALAAHHLQGISLGPDCPSIHSLLFADDLLVCGQATMQEANSMAQLIHHFCYISGQTPNWAKSAILFSTHVSQTTIQEIKQVFPVSIMDNNFTHLGHPLILPAKNRTATYNFVIDKFLNKLPAYKANMLSHAARLELIRSVFSAIPVYYMSNILFTKKFIAKLTAIIRNFWWTGIRENNSNKSLCLRAWKDICNSKLEGGLGIRNLQAINEGLLLAAAWRLAKDPSSHLHLVLKSKYFHDASIWTAISTTPKSAFWSSILKMLPKLKDHSFYQLTQGNISLWSTPWCSLWASVHDNLIIQPSGYIYPSLVKDLWIPGQKVWNNDLINSLFQQPLASVIIQTDIIHQDCPDILCWDLTPNGTCSSKSTYKLCLQDIHANPRNTPSQVSLQMKNLLKLI
uniref:Reverse transcriptase domain-containing protein n=1 Tax=Triticum urartu TaxID=4572 RepID=A0A8R7PPL8_TRIUA